MDGSSVGRPKIERLLLIEYAYCVPITDPTVELPLAICVKRDRRVDTRVRILMVGAFPADLDQPRGGVESATVALTRALGGLSVEIDVVCAASADRGQVGTQITGFGSVVFVTPSPHAVSRESNINRTVHDMWNSGGYDCLHLQGVARVGPRVPNRVLTVHGIIEKDARFESSRAVRFVRRHSIVRREVLARNSEPNIIVIDDYVTTMLPHLRSRRVWEIRNAVSDTYFEVVSCLRKPDLVFAGRIIERKDVLGLVEAFHLVVGTRPDARLLLVGPGVESEYGRLVVSEVSHLGLTDRVLFLGELTELELAGLLARSSCLVLAARQETAPMVIGEALATGTPIVACDVGGVRAMVGKAGVVVRAGSPEEFAAGICRVLNEPLLFQPYTRPASQFYEARRVAEQTLLAYNTITRM